MSHEDAVAQVLSTLTPFLSMSADELHSSDENGRARAAHKNFLSLLEQGHVRAATWTGPQQYSVNAVVKQAILLGFRLGRLVEMGDASLPFVDKDTYPVRGFALHDQVRIVPGGTSVRRGAHIARSVTLMPPAYVNVGAFVDEGTMIDSHALVGSCAQVGKRVHVSAAAQLGGVLEPIGAMPVIVEDDVLIGGNCGVYEGTIVGTRAVLGAGVVLTRGTKLFDLVHARVIEAVGDAPLVVPPGAVVVMGSRPASGGFAKQHQLQIATPLVVKYRDDRTDAKTALESALR
jgi:2,3,4,5-tetrahydropyridine-2,6-dicarboxylate N-succinyltransferase